MKENEIREQIKIATTRVETWPAWKRNILVESAQPTVKLPRTPVNNQSATGEKPESSK